MAVFNLRTTLELTYQCPHATSLLEDLSPIDNPIMTPVGAIADTRRWRECLIVIPALVPVKAQPGVGAEINANIKTAGVALPGRRKDLPRVARQYLHPGRIQTGVTACALTCPNGHRAIGIVIERPVWVLEGAAGKARAAVIKRAQETLAIPIFGV